jgi:hypothetical protein
MYPDYGTDPVIPTAAEPEPSPEACDCGLRVDEDADVRGEHHMRRCPRFAFAPAVSFEPGLVRFDCSCGHVSEHSSDGPGRLVGVQCGCGREMRRV